MKSFSELKKEINTLTGSLLLIGNFDDKKFPLTKGNNLSDIYYLNSNNFTDSTVDVSLKDIASNIHLKELHKYFKDGVDNIYCNYDEIKDYIPSFFRESLRITKKNIYIVFNNKKNYSKIEKKYKRYNINCTLYSFNECNIAIIEANDIMVNPIKEFYYYLLDKVESIYNYISENV